MDGGFTFTCDEDYFGSDPDVYRFDPSDSDEVQASRPFHVDINPEVICNDDAAWEKEVVPAFAELGFICIWTSDNKMGFSIDPKLGPLEDTSVYFRAVNALNAFACGFPAHWALKPLSGDMEFDSFELTPAHGSTEAQLVERYNIFKGLYQHHPELQALPCAIRFYDEPDISLVASKLLIYLLVDFSVEFIKCGGDFESLAKELLEDHERLKDHPFPYMDDTMETGKALSDALGRYYCYLSRFGL
ncbi:uncharacterized protein LOC133741286 [Rosa rugosa]|uniref:uncharacterized protein LOC133741286 n=1 Tax=Rosa rugosa TaxID=74645 RepID=UPI002B40D43D|nr:uncharacterized protein LOC133741286 [Rosa rugosa]